MQLKDKQPLVLGGMAILALVGLLAVQWYWLSGILQLQKNAFEENLYRVLKVIDDEYEDDLEPIYDLDQILIAPNSDTAHLFLNQLIQIIEYSFEKSDLNYAYEYALTSLDGKRFQYFSDSTKASQILSKGSRKKLGVGLTSNPEQDINGGKHHFYLYLYIPQEREILYQSTIWAITLSAFFILFLIGIFAYTLYNLIQQKQLSALKNDFINNLTHEIKTPIATVSLASRTLKKLESVHSSTQALNYVNLIDQEAKRLENHIDKVLQLSLLDSGNFELDKSPVDIHEKLEQVMNSLALLLKEKAGQFQYEFNATQATLKGDALHLFNTFYNVIDNAIKYTDTRPLIQIRTDNRKDSIAIRIEDNGIGMPEQAQQFIFEKFYRLSTTNRKNVDGFGLGLSYVKQIVEAHKGQIELESVTEQGTVFTIILPL